jgi:hypothetical protein
MDASRSGAQTMIHPAKVRAIMRRRARARVAGAPVEADAATLQSQLDASLIGWLGHLKRAAEAAG